jgi:hypothetical protein
LRSLEFWYSWIAPYRGPSLWAAAGTEHDPTPDAAFQTTPTHEFDQRIAW